MTTWLRASVPRLGPLIAVVVLVASMGGTWTTTGHAYASPASTAPRDPPGASPGAARGGKRAVTGKLNLNTATVDQLQLLPSVGPAKAARIVAWRARNGGFRRTADLRRVSGFGYKTYKRLEPLLAVTGETTLAAR